MRRTQVRHNDVYSKRVYLTVSSSVYYFLSILENSYIIFNPIQRQNKKDAPFSVAPFFILLQKDSLNIQDNLWGKMLEIGDIQNKPKWGIPKYTAIRFIRNESIYSFLTQIYSHSSFPNLRYIPNRSKY